MRYGTPIDVDIQVLKLKSPGLIVCCRKEQQSECQDARGSYCGQLCSSAGRYSDRRSIDAGHPERALELLGVDLD